MGDVVVTTNLFGDILSDESSQVVGGLGMAPTANIGDSFALFEPVQLQKLLIILMKIEIL